jgi:hypothetical protein
MLSTIAAKVIYLRDASVNQALDEGSAEKIRCAASTISGLHASWTSRKPDFTQGCTKRPSGSPRTHFASLSNGKIAGD